MARAAESSQFVGYRLARARLICTLSVCPSIRIDLSFTSFRIEMTFPRISSPPFLTSAFPESKRIESTMLTVSFPLSSEIVTCPWEISDFIFSSRLS